MRYLQASILTLYQAGYTPPAQANSFYPAGNQTDHIHLGVPTTYSDHGTQRTAEPGNVFVTYISFKRDDAFWFRLDHDDQDGYFSFPHAHQINQLPQAWQDALHALNMIRGLGA